MKRIRWGLIRVVAGLVLASLMPQAALAVTPVGSTFDYEGLRYSVLTSDTVQVGTGVWVASLTTTDNVEIPSVALDASGTAYSVTAIAQNAFRQQGDTMPYSVTIPNSVRSIGDYAFEQSQIDSLVLPSSLTTIGQQAFADCYRLSEVEIPSSVTTVGPLAFQACISLTTATVLPALAEIPSGMFYSCGHLRSVNVPPSVTSIGPWAFQWCNALTSIDLPDSVASIGERAFLQCGITWSKLPASLTYVGPDAFTGTKWDLSKTTISGIDPSYAFRGTSIQPEPVVSMGSYVLPKWTTYWVAYDNTVYPGTATVRIYEQYNASNSKDATFGISPVSIASATISGLAPSYTYTGDGIRPYPTLDLNGVDLSNSNFGTMFDNNVNVGTATVTVQGERGLFGSATRTFRILPARIPSAGVTGVRRHYDYSGEPLAVHPEVHYGSRFLYEGVDYRVTYSGIDRPGNAMLTVIGMGNYSGRVTRRFNIRLGLTKGKLSLKRGRQYKLKVEGGTGAIAWWSSDTHVATVSASGVVIAQHAGTATVTAWRNGYRLACRVTVR